MRTPPNWRDVAKGYDSAAAGYDQRHGDARSQTRFRIIEKPLITATAAACCVLELGCGTGRLLSQVQAPTRVGIDISRVMMAQAPERIDNPVAADAHLLPFRADAFDAILAGKGVFRYLDHPRAFSESARVLRPGGRLALHLYASTTWSVQRLIPRSECSPVSSPDRHQGNPPEVTDIDDFDDIYRPAGNAGLIHRRTYLWRSVRFKPYALSIPTWMPGHWWSHAVLVFSKA